MCAFVHKYVLLYAKENYKNMYFAKLPYYIVLWLEQFAEKLEMIQINWSI